LIIPPGKTLYLKDKKIIFSGAGDEDEMEGIIVAYHAGAIDFSDWPGGTPNAVLKFGGVAGGG
jgi:hypothetical protein